ncbi:MAG: single-stranded-DNA-specific exonuclease RecJ [Calditrichaeota bacterium]|nr:single-stranded-DNA-specific exonuclease RecJ [Calditrichota bacterium]
MNLKWVLNDKISTDAIYEFAQQLKVPLIIAKILITRGVDTFDKAKLFFRGNLDDLHDPFLMQDMGKAVERIVDAIRKKEKVLIYGDYDVDGITSVSTLYLLLNDLYAEVSYYIPHRVQEGYGISKLGIDEAAKQGVSLIISVDCGITAVKEIEYARQRGIDVIISDHHEQGPELPDAYAVLDPKCERSNYPFQELAGVGVAYKLGQALVQYLDLEPEYMTKYLDLVAIGSTADIVPLIDENRIFVREGLRLINQTDKPGLQALLSVSGLADKPIGTGQIVFILAPRLNAVGRLSDAAFAVKLLTTRNPRVAWDIANMLENENRARKNIDEDTFRQAQSLVDSDYDLSRDFGLVLAKDGWHPGVIGIVASRVVEKYYRPTVMISVDTEMGKGSARSINGFDIFEAIQQCEDLLVGYGGHKYAAGLTIEKDKIAEFRKRFNEIAKANLDDDLLQPKLRIDGRLRLADISPRLVQLLKLFAPFGPQNTRPIFQSDHLQVVGNPAIVGRNHLKFRVRQDGIVFDAIGFNLGDLIYRIEPGSQNLDMAYVIEENTYMGRTQLQLRVKDLR